MDRVTRDISVRKMLALNKFIGTDESFERPLGCWSPSDHNSYLESVWSRDNANPIVVSNNNESRQFSQNIGNTSSQTYFNKQLSEGNKFTSIDGQHRRNAIKEFVGGERNFTGVAEDHEGNKRFFRSVYFKDLPEQFQDSFMESEIVWQEYTLTRAQMSVLWRRINSGASPTAQQMRNAIQTPIAKWTRDTARDYKDLWGYVYGNASKMKQHELVTKIYSHIDNIKNDVGKSKLDALYMEGEGKTSFSPTYNAYVKDCTEQVIQKLSQVVTSKAAEKEVIPLILVLCKTVEEGLQIDDPAKFRKAVVATDDALSDASHAAYGSAKQQGLEPKELDYYFKQCNNNWGSPARGRRQATLWKEICADLAKHGLSDPSLEEAVAAK
jgi:hypothetical protein